MIRWRQDQQNLTVDYDTGEVPLDHQQRHPLELAAARIRKRCHDLTQPILYVRVTQDERTREFEVELVLEALQRSLKGIGKADNLPDAAESARDKILSQMGPFKAMIRREEAYRLQHRHDAPEPIRALSDPTSGENPDLKNFERQLEAYWRPLVRQVSREISALEMNNLLPLGELAAQDIVDEVIVRAFERFRNRPSDVPLEIWLYQQARQVLAERREQLQRETPMSSVPPQRSMKETLPPPNPLTDAEEVLMDLLEPEVDALPGDDIVDATGVTDPTLPHRRNELHQVLRRVISHLPPQQREAIWLHYLDGFDVAEIAAVQDRDEKDVRSDLEQAVSRLRDALYTWRGWTPASRDEGYMHKQPRAEPEA